MNYKIGTIDIGGTNSRMAIFENDQIVKNYKFLTDSLNRIKSLEPIIEIIEKEQLEYLSVCMPGPADYPNGKIYNPPNMNGWWDFDLKNYLLSNSKIKEVIFENDANAMALAVHKEFNQTEKDITQLFTLSTGLGAGLVINDKIFTGTNYSAQEINSLPAAFIKEDGENLKIGAVELFASGSGLVKRAKRRNMNWTTKEIFNLYGKNEIATRLIDEGIETLANLISISLAMINPNLIVFSGSVALNNKWFVDVAIKEAKSRSLAVQYNNVKFAFTSYNDECALYGLYYLMKNKLSNK